MSLIRKKIYILFAIGFIISFINCLLSRGGFFASFGISLLIGLSFASIDVIFICARKCTPFWVSYSSYRDNMNRSYNDSSNIFDWFIWLVLNLIVAGIPFLFFFFIFALISHFVTIYRYFKTDSWWDE